MSLENLDWNTLSRLRRHFLEGTGGKVDYWQSNDVLDAYDQTFGRRIGWKWDFALEQLKNRQWTPPAGSVLDWGCGSGVAGRAFLRHFGLAGVSQVGFFDRSVMAMEFAASRAKTEFPDLKINPAACNRQADVLLISHVINELSPAKIDELVELACKATSVIWVEPGSYQAGRSLIKVRQRLLSEFNVVAPCTHNGSCLMLDESNHKHWCHHFASSPAEVFMDGNWARFAKLEGIDLRSLPLSYLVLDRRPIQPLPPKTMRIIGRPRVFKGYALLFGCNESALGDRKLAKKNLPQEYKALKSKYFDTLFRWPEQSGDI